VGATEMYEARCRRCFEPNPAQARKEAGPVIVARSRGVAGGAT